MGTAALQLPAVAAAATLRAASCSAARGAGLPKQLKSLVIRHTLYGQGPGLRGGVLGCLRGLVLLLGVFILLPVCGHTGINQECRVDL
jgi:hypothetical protein